MGGGWSTSSPGRFTPGKDTVTIVQEAGWAPAPVWKRCEKISPPPGFDPRTAQPVASRCTDYAISAHNVGGESVVMCSRRESGSSLVNTVSVNNILYLRLQLLWPRLCYLKPHSKSSYDLRSSQSVGQSVSLGDGYCYKCVCDVTSGLHIVKTLSRERQRERERERGGGGEIEHGRRQGQPLYLLEGNRKLTATKVHKQCRLVLLVNVYSPQGKEGST